MDLSPTSKVCIIGGGATGLSLLWALKSQNATRGVEVTLLHDQKRLGGHSITYPIPLGGVEVPVDLGVQFCASPAVGLPVGF